jgi:hypothetical protein
VVKQNKNITPSTGKRTFKGKAAILQYIFEQALKHDVQFARKLADDILYEDHRLVISDDGQILLLARESQLKTKKK